MKDWKYLSVTWEKGVYVRKVYRPNADGVKVGTYVVAISPGDRELFASTSEREARAFADAWHPGSIYYNRVRD